MDVDVEEGGRVGGEEAVPEWGEVEVGVGEEEEGDFELGVWGAGGEMGGRSGGGAAEEDLVVDLVGDGDGGFTRRRKEDMRGEEEEEDGETEEEGEGDYELVRQHFCPRGGMCLA